MKILTVFFLIMSFIGCTQVKDLGYAKKIQRLNERVTQLDVKVVRADLRMKRVENVSKELLEKYIELKIRFDNMVKLQNNEAKLQKQLEKEKEKNKTLAKKLKAKTWKPVKANVRAWGEGSKKYIKNLAKEYETSKELGKVNIKPKNLGSEDEYYQESGTPKKQSENAKLIGKKLGLSRFIDSQGEVLDLEEFEGKKKVLLVILRGFAGSVCPACSAQTLAITNTIKQFQDENVEVLVVYPGKAESVPIFLEAVTNLKKNFKPAFKFLLDVDLNFVKLLKIQGSLAKPASLILDKKGIVRYAYVGKNYRDRPSVRVLLEEISKLK